jgi:AbrB family looped-hinge helix DNA binding protein
LAFANGKLPAVKTQLIQIDKAGRVVLPKPLRDRFNLVPGDKLRLLVEGNAIRFASGICLPALGGAVKARLNPSSGRDFIVVFRKRKLPFSGHALVGGSIQFVA